MKLLFVADGRSPTSAGWIGYFIGQGYEVHLVSTYPSAPLPGLASFDVIPAGLLGRSAASSGSAPGLLRRITGPGFRTAVRRRLETRTLTRRAGRLRQRIREVSPDLVHALRIPFEGMLAAEALSGQDTMAMRKMPLVLSIWGNDLTLHAQSGPGLAALTRSALGRADAVLADCRRDIRLARTWGAQPDRPAAVFPGGGGVRSGIFYPVEPPPQDALRIVQPRGLRAYVENEAFLRAVPAVLERFPEARFICPGLAGSEPLTNLTGRLGIAYAVELLPPVTQSDLADLFRSAAIVLSPTTHDGTPNSLIEAMACGCFPVAGDLESIREWIDPGENGVLVDAASPASIASGLLHAIQDPGLRRRAREINFKQVSERGAYENVMPDAERFYAGLV